MTSPNHDPRSVSAARPRSPWTYALGGAVVTLIGVAFLLAALRGVPQHHWPYGDMPPVPGLSEEDLQAIVAYVREQQRLNGFEPYPP